MTNGAVLITGCQRSGTTLLNLILDSHPLIHGIDENDFDPGRLGDYIGDPAFGPFVSFKLPLQAPSLGLLKAIPGLRLLWCMRDPRDVVTSMITLRLQSATGEVLSWVSHPLGARLDIERCRPVAGASVLDAMQKYLDAFDLLCARTKPGEWLREDLVRIGALCWTIKNALLARYDQDRIDYHRVRYEDLVSEPRLVVSGILEYIRAPWNDRVMQHHQLHRGHSIGGTDNQRAIDCRSAGRWKAALTTAEVALITEICGETAASLGYEL